MNKVLYIIAGLLLGCGLNAQNRLAYTEFGLGIGTLNYSGEIATTKTLGALVQEARPNISLMAERHLNDWFGFGLQTSLGWIYANDLNHTHQNRGLELNTSVFQINPFIEIDFIRFGKHHFDRKFTFYLKAGGGLVAYNPEVVAAEVFPPDFEIEPHAYESFNYFGALGLKFRVGYQAILRIEASVHNSGADNMDGLIAKDPLATSANDTYGGINVVFSRMIF